MKTTLTSVLAVTLLASCGGTGPGEQAAEEDVLLHGAGATFPYPVYAKWFEEFHRARPHIRINYQSIGSGGGIRQLLAGTVDFGASDVPMNDEQLAQSRAGILHFPTVVGAVVPTYNVPGLEPELNFSPETLADIFLGAIRQWDDSALTAINAGVSMPAREIVVVRRSDGSGTTFVWTDYLAKVSPEWKTRVGTGPSVRWPVGLGAKGNEGLAGMVKQTPYSIGYVELVYAMQNRMAYGRMRNAAGEFVKADLTSVSTAAMTPMPEDFRVSLTDSQAAGAYPISSFTWLLIPRRIPDPRKRQAMVEFLQWMLGEGQPISAALGYAPLPAEVAGRERAAISQIQ